ncbi:transcriptional repressor [Siphonobacter sp.]|uniref:transcriptional repressor n=1 Tax=Siphonobacter sp. TaxID=1869184 RepID=UPI003B3B4D1B
MMYKTESKGSKDTLSITERIRAYGTRHGIRHSPKRNAVAMVLEKATRAMDAEQVWLQLKQEHVRISIGAVYLSLNWLVKAQLAQKKIREDRKAVFERI